MMNVAAPLHSYTGSNLATWSKLSSFEVFGDYTPMNGFRVAIALSAEPAELHKALERRSADSPLLDPDLARFCLRAGLGLVSSHLVDFVYSTCDATVAVVRPELARASGAPVIVQNRLHALFTARLTLLLGHEVVTSARIYEFPDLRVVRRALTSLAEEVEETTPLRTATWLGAQLRGRGEAFHPSMLETLEEQMSLLQAHGVDMERLPPWWWRGVAAAVRNDGTIAVFDELPPAEGLGKLVPES